MAYSSDGALLALGLADGSISILRPKTVAPGGTAPRGRSVAAAAGAAAAGAAAAAAAYPTGGTGAIEVLAFAPRSSGTHGGLLACGSHDRMLRVFELVPQSTGGAADGGRLKLVPRCVCSGHTATVTHLDWSADGTMIMSNCAAHEILCWAVSPPAAAAAAG